MPLRAELGPELFRPAIANVGTGAVCMLQGRAMWSIESCLFLLIPVTRLPKPRILHSTPLSLVVSRCSQHIPYRNSSPVLVSCAPFECLLSAPQCSASLLPKSFLSTGISAMENQTPDASVRFAELSRFYLETKEMRIAKCERVWTSSIQTPS